MTHPFAIQLIKHYESLHDGDLKLIGLQPKMCPAGVWTMGYGRAIIDPKTGRMLNKPEDKALAYQLYHTITTEDAEKFLLEDLNRFAISIQASMKCSINEAQFGACVSLSYNIGIGNFTKSSVVRLIRTNKLHEAADAFLMWNKVRLNGSLKELRGLTARRQSERHLFLTGEFKPFN